MDGDSRWPDVTSRNSRCNREEALAALASPLEQVLGPAGYSSYLSLRERQLERLLLRVPQN
jgi:hypothetical protein